MSVPSEPLENQSAQFLFCSSGTEDPLGTYKGSSGCLLSTLLHGELFPDITDLYIHPYCGILGHDANIATHQCESLC